MRKQENVLETYLHREMLQENNDLTYYQCQSLIDAFQQEKDIHETAETLQLSVRNVQYWYLRLSMELTTQAMHYTY